MKKSLLGFDEIHCVKTEINLFLVQYQAQMLNTFKQTTGPLDQINARDVIYKIIFIGFNLIN